MATVLADIGGTNARFAILQDGTTSPVTQFEVDRFSDIEQALRGFLAEHAQKTSIDHAAIAVAGPVRDGEAQLTNASWRISGRALTAAFGWRSVVVLNDFEAMAMALPRLASADLSKIGPGEADPHAPMVVLGPGTGFGLAAFVPTRAGPVPLVTEGGHATLPSTDDRESLIVGALRRRFEHVSIERVLSGDGLGNLHAAIADVDGIAAEPRDAAAIVEDAASGERLAAVTLEAFCAMLGTASGNIALTIGARGGVYVAGGIVPRIVDVLKASSFRERFEAKGRFRDYMAAIPTFVITRPNPAFLGLAAVAGG
jgi:glucokinase